MIAIKIINIRVKYTIGVKNNETTTIFTKEKPVLNSTVFKNE